MEDEPQYESTTQFELYTENEKERVNSPNRKSMKRKEKKIDNYMEQECIECFEVNTMIDECSNCKSNICVNCKARCDKCQKYYCIECEDEHAEECQK
jgi:hypothetical protein